MEATLLMWLACVDESQTSSHKHLLLQKQVGAHPGLARTVLYDDSSRLLQAYNRGPWRA